MIAPRIVAEISRQWPSEISDHGIRSDFYIRSDFERVIEANRERGYKLESWQAIATAVDGMLVETIIAVFVENQQN